MTHNPRIEKVLRFLEEHGLEYELHTHPPLPTIELALEYWKDIDSTHCKNLFFRNHKGNRHYLVVFECHKELAIHSLEHALKQGKLSFASPERMERCLGLLPGSVSPLGLINDMGLAEVLPDGMLNVSDGVNAKEVFPNGHRVKLFLDQDLRDAERVSFHPCDNTASVVLSNADFIKYLEIWGGEYEWIDVNAEL
ncbi:MAG: prolyl-tRNA synthetase associated domain-containing protein [Bacteroidales bacterium]|nr:prolyl-tRNA synthetase associated domain-containing protein [Bacteroidales bacterium]